MHRRIRDSAIIITGASSGIGKALAIELGGRGASLALAARRLERLRRINLSLDERHLCSKTDVADPVQCKMLINAALQRFGRIDTLVCNAGFGLIKPIMETSDDDAHDMFATNVRGTLNCIRPAVEAMLRQPLRDGYRGQVLIISSAAARRGLPEFGAYTATKAAQLSIAEALRVELRGRSIAVTTVHPVTTATEFFRTAMRLSQSRPPRRCGIETLQSAEHVAAMTVQAIERPRAEVWPRAGFQLLMSMATFAPAITDRILAWRMRPPATLQAPALNKVAGTTA